MDETVYALAAASVVLNAVNLARCLAGAPASPNSIEERGRHVGAVHDSPEILGVEGLTTVLHICSGSYC